MDYNKNINETAGCIGMIMYTLVVTPIAFFVESSKKPPEIKLRELNLPPMLGLLIQPLPCPKCQAINETGPENCQFCGALLHPQEEFIVGDEVFASEANKIAVAIVIGGFILSLILAVMFSG